MKHIRRRHTLLLALLIVVTTFKVVTCLGTLYTNTIYPLIADCLSSISSLIPFPIGDIFITTSIFGIIANPIYQIAYKQRCWKTISLHIIEYLAWMYAWFYAAWGLNYSQPNIYRRMRMQAVNASAPAFRDFAYKYADSLNATYEREIQKEKIEKNKVQNDIFNGYILIGQHAKHMGINRPFSYHSPAKTMLFSHISSMAGVTGSMAPFFCEFTLNADLQPHEYPATYAHEYAHFLGIANEGEANFYSYVVCTASTDNRIRFSGYYHILFHMLSNVRELLGEHEYMAYIDYISPDIIRLARHDRQYWLSRRSTILDSTQDFVYNLYLRGNRVEGGMKSYSGVVGIIMAWEEKRNAGLGPHAL